MLAFFDIIKSALMELLSDRNTLEIISVKGREQTLCESSNNEKRFASKSPDAKKNTEILGV